MADHLLYDRCSMRAERNVRQKKNSTSNKEKSQNDECITASTYQSGSTEAITDKEIDPQVHNIGISCTNVIHKCIISHLTITSQINAEIQQNA